MLRRLLHRYGLILFWLMPPAVAASEAVAGSLYSRWKYGPSPDPSFFPVAVWLQNPANAARYREAGINVFVGLWKGPTDEQLAILRSAGMQVICEQNEIGLRHREDTTIIGWMHGDEPDNAQPLPGGDGFGPPIEPDRIKRDYDRIRAADPSRPVLLNLGQGVAWDAWYGRGSRSRHPEDYPHYVQGGDIVSFDIYPVTHEHPDVAGNLGMVARGVKRLTGWAGPDRMVWNCIECTRIHHPDRKPTPWEVRAQVWMSLIHGSRGIIYFVHEWKPRFEEAALLKDAEMFEAVRRINHRVQAIAPVLNRPSVPGLVEVGREGETAPVAVMAKVVDRRVHLFAVAMANDHCLARFRVKGLRAGDRIEVLDESRELVARDGFFEDRFEGWGVHLYRFRESDLTAEGEAG